MPSTERTSSPGTSDRVTESAFRGLIRTLGLLERVMQPYFAQFGISTAQWGVLRTLHRAEQEGLPGLRLTDLSERLLIRPPSVTGVIDRLERAGLVMRSSVKEDLRAKKVELSTQGRQLLDRVLEVHQGQIDAVMKGLSRPEQTELNRLLEKLSEHLTGLLSQRPAASENE